MKKFLSMALALVMTLSLCTFVNTTKADAAFTDVEELSSQYAEQAADVIQAIEVMDGYDDGSFRPTAGLTRQAAAKIICNMILGPTTARALPTNANPFPDVLAGNQFSGYISYCAQQGIISGYGDGTFRPGDPLSGYAYLKMLLGALGYDSTHEGFVGDNWKVNVAKIALGIGLNKGIDEELDGSTQVTRESAAIYAFNTLQADMVEYESKNTLEINGVKVSMGGGNAVPQTWGTSATSANNISAMTDNGTAIDFGGKPIVQFAERYFDKLERDPNGFNGLNVAPTNTRDRYGRDDFGRPAIKWTWKGVEIGTYARDPDAVFVGGVKVNAIYEALGMTSGGTGNLFINSRQPNNTALDVSRSNDKDLDNARNLNKNANNAFSSVTTDDLPDGTAHYVDRIGDGCIIECFRNDADNTVEVCVISVYAGKVASVKGATAKKDAYVTIDVGKDANHNPQTIKQGNNNEYETEDFEEDDVVAYTYSDSAEEIKDMYLLSAESGALQSKVSKKSLRLGDVTYKYGKEYNFDGDLTENDLSTKSSYIVYLDENDFVLWVEEDEFSVDNYVLIERITIETTVGNTTTKTASVIDGQAETKPSAVLDNDEVLQVAYNQSKDAVGNSSWDAQAQVRYPNGTRRTVTLDDSKNYRTSAESDANYTYIDATHISNKGVNTLINKADVDDYGTISGDNENGKGDGNWIAEPFTAGKIVRISSNSSGYRLNSINPDRLKVVNNVVLDGNKIQELKGGTIIGGVMVGGTLNNVLNEKNKSISADSETHFAIDDVGQGSYKSYVGIKNAPDVGWDSKQSTFIGGSTAYIYYNETTAKLVFITKAAHVSSSSNDIVFLAANSLSDLIESDDGKYYEISAVEKNEIKTLRIKATGNNTIGYTGCTFAENDVLYTPGKSANKAYNCVILNNVTYDSNDFITAGSFDGGKSNDDIYMAHGIRRVNSEEIRVNTANGKSSELKDVAENIRVFFVDGDNIEQIDYSEIVNDTEDYVYYVQNSNAEVTYLFIVDYEPDDDIATASIPTGSREFVQAGKSYVIDTSVTTLSAGEKFTFTVHNTNDDTYVKAGVQVKYVIDEDGNKNNAAVAFNATDDQWEATIGNNLFDGSDITFVVP